MRNPYETYPIVITKIESQNAAVKLFTFMPKDRNNIKCSSDEKKIVKCWWPGQFIALSIPGFGEAPFAVCSSPSPCREFQLCVQNKGSVTNKLFMMSVGDEVYFRGPYGNGFPITKLSKRNLLLIAGGLGLVPLRPLIQVVTNHATEFGKVQLFSGSREEKMMLFKNEYSAWQKDIELNFTLDTPHENWTGSTGLITALFDKAKNLKGSVAIVCGPPVMYQAVVNKLTKKGVQENDIYLLMERRMHCGVGICQHCVLVNGKYVCKDGPVFNYAEIKNVPGAI
jgi:NAD(P)H-flavin reductase